MYRNDEGYKDPTAGLAMSRYMKDYRSRQRDKWRREELLKHRPMVYVIAPYAGDIEGNTKATIRFCQHVISMDKIPISSVLLLGTVLDDNIPEQRECGRLYGLSLLAFCSEAWVYTEKRSEGMRAEISEAKALGITIRYFKEAADGKIIEQRDS